jgi:hypothetical protein
MRADELKAFLQQAADLSAIVPESLQAIAFSKTLDVLLGDEIKDEARNGRPAGLKKPAARRERANTSRTGPKSALQKLVSEGFFGNKKSIPDIQAYLKDSRGHEYSPNELSISLLRLVRSQLLDRNRNPEGQYEYWAK